MTLLSYCPKGFDRFTCFTLSVDVSERQQSTVVQVAYTTGVYACGPVISLAVTGSNQAYRTISTGQLNALLHLHLRPIDVVVYHGPQGYLVLRGASRLDAFSGYPVRS